MASISFRTLRFDEGSHDDLFPRTPAEIIAILQEERRPLSSPEGGTAVGRAATDTLVTFGPE